MDEHKLRVVGKAAVQVVVHTQAVAVLDMAEAVSLRSGVVELVLV